MPRLRWVAMAAPVRIGDELELHVDSLAYGGNGVARKDGFVVFVRSGLPGDTVRARVTKVKRGFAEALAEEVLAPSIDRVEAPCRHFGACGGCRSQDYAYDAPAGCEGVAGARCAHPASPDRRPAARADRPCRVSVPLPQQARVLVHRDGGRACARVPSRRPLGRGARDRGVPAHDRPRQRDPRRGA